MAVTEFRPAITEAQEQPIKLGPQTMPLAAIIIGARIRRDLGDIRALAASIAALGLLHPIVVSPSGVLLAGHRRLEACRLLGWRHVNVNVVKL